MGSKAESKSQATLREEDGDHPTPEAIAHLKSMTAFKPVSHIHGAPMPPRRGHKRQPNSLGSSPKRKLSSSRDADSDSDSGSSQSGGIWNSDDSDESDDDAIEGQRSGTCFPFIGGKHKPNIPSHDKQSNAALSKTSDTSMEDVGTASIMIYYCQIVWHQFTNQFRDTAIEVDTQRVRIHWFSNKFHPKIYESAFVEATIREGFDKTRGLMFAIWVIAGGYVINSSFKLTGKQPHEADMYLAYFLGRLIVFIFITIIVIISVILGCGRNRNVSPNASTDRSAKEAEAEHYSQNMPLFLRYRNVVWSSLLVIFGCIAMITKAFKVRHEQSTVLGNLDVGLNLVENVTHLNKDDSSLGANGLNVLWETLYPNVTASSSEDWINVLDKPEMNGGLSLREMVHKVHVFNTHEYEVIMNRIWPPLMVVVSTLVIKRFASALITALCVSVCWFAIFVSGPLAKNSEWLGQWQEIGFQFFIQGILLFGAKTADRKERIDFLNTFGKHLQAERVMKKLNQMREEMDKRATSRSGEGPNTILGDVFEKLSKVQNAVLTMQSRHRKHTIISGERDSSDLSDMRNSSKEMILIDEVKTMLLNNIDNLQQPVMSIDALHSVPEEERAWYNEGGAGSSRKAKKLRLSYQATTPLTKMVNKNKILKVTQDGSRVVRDSAEPQPVTTSQNRDAIGEASNVDKIVLGIHKEASDQGRNNAKVDPQKDDNDSASKVTDIDSGITSLDISMSDARETKFQRLVAQCRHHEWNLDTLSIMEQGFNPCLVVGLGICDRHSTHHGFLKRFMIERATWGNFCEKIGEGYLPETDVPYHNAAHGADVMNSVHYILDKAGLRRKRGDHSDLRSAEFFGSLVAAMIHDYKHPGVNSQFLRNTRHSLSLQYLDDSPLERMHVAEAYMLCASSTDLDIFKNMKAVDYDDVRKVVVTLVLATDLANHFPFVEQLKLLHGQMMARNASESMRISRKDTQSSGAIELSEDESSVSGTVLRQLSRCSNIDNMMAMKIAIKLSDIGHCAKELSLHKKWTERVTEEFYRQVCKVLLYEVSTLDSNSLHSFHATIQVLNLPWFLKIIIFS